MLVTLMPGARHDVVPARLRAAKNEVDENSGAQGTHVQWVMERPGGALLTPMGAVLSWLARHTGGHG